METEKLKEKIKDLFKECLDLDCDGSHWISRENYEFSIETFNSELDLIFNEIIID